MILTFLYIILAALGLGFLIFIHEFGHYWMARKEGMTVETFSIGFGKPFYMWERGGVKWQICYLPFGGFVRIAGMEKKGNLEPHQIADGFYGKGPLALIKVALMGPLVNIVFAFLAFCALWFMGGREKPFSEYTHLLGFVEKESPIYIEGIRPGDSIDKINGSDFRNFQDFIYAALLQKNPPLIEGEKIDYLGQTESSFSYRFSYLPKWTVIEKVQSIFGAISPASYLIYNAKASFAFDQDSPMKDSGIEDGDRIIWVDGELIFSKEQLVQTINEPKALLTVQRGSKIFLARVPRLRISDLRTSSQHRSELEDWQHEAALKGRVQDLFFIPYNLDSTGKVQNSLPYLNAKSLEETPALVSRSGYEVPLESGDQILAVDGIEVHSAYEMMAMLQTRHLQVIVKKQARTSPVSWMTADKAFTSGIDFVQLQEMIASIGTREAIEQRAGLQMLKPVEPRPLLQMPLSQVKRASLEKQMQEQKKQIEAIKDPKHKEMALQLFEQERSQLKLGIVMTDLLVNYNPSPVALFGHVFQETWKTLVALFTGSMTPKYLSGPVGIVQVMQKSWSYGSKEAIFWLGMISLNLGILNLMPIPVLDGGHICFALWEKITGKRISAKMMERLIIPFVVLMIVLFVYLTYNDLMRIFTGLF